MRFYCTNAKNRWIGNSASRSGCSCGQVCKITCGFFWDSRIPEEVVCIYLGKLRTSSVFARVQGGCVGTGRGLWGVIRVARACLEFLFRSLMWGVGVGMTFP